MRKSRFTESRIVEILRADEAGVPAALRLDNGPELTAQVFTDWCRARQIAVHYIQQGKPTQNAFIGRFSRPYREEVLDAYLFESLDAVQRLSDDWLTRYNTVRLHDALGRVPPLTYLPRAFAPAEPTNPWPT
jgi:putative transposase